MCRSQYSLKYRRYVYHTLNHKTCASQHALTYRNMYITACFSKKKICTLQYSLEYRTYMYIAQYTLKYVTNVHHNML